MIFNQNFLRRRYGSFSGHYKAIWKIMLIIPVSAVSYKNV